VKIKQYKKLSNVTALKKSHSKCKRWCHLAVRFRDIKRSKDGSYYFICIACRKRFEITLFSDRSIYNGRNLQASHYFNSDKNESVRYDLDNLHLSCERCNSPRGLHGNKENYQVNLRHKIGVDRFENLKAKAHKTYKFNIIELEKMEDEFKMLAQLNANKLQIKI
jgi:5-methylcytosine-specific restriction endonuclease McrA